jgi:hypothetical protein
VLIDLGFGVHYMEFLCVPGAVACPACKGVDTVTLTLEPCASDCILVEVGVLPGDRDVPLGAPFPARVLTKVGTNYFVPCVPSAKEGATYPQVPVPWDHLALVALPPWMMPHFEKLDPSATGVDVAELAMHYGSAFGSPLAKWNAAVRGHGVSQLRPRLPGISLV